ncbi:uncharacterized protein METZ01_LOCUS2307 [marine metagenome]|uniref:Uncharacterized protein n=1 Tax=marine metagenome TaxID=408172 RepID=A0A381N792_9ZZZZ
MKLKINSRFILWSIVLIFYTIFFCWYTNLKGPLSTEEIDYYVERLIENGSSPENIKNAKKFLIEDKGKDFYMLNMMDFSDSPPDLPETGPNASASDLMNHYMEYMFPELLSRACHPIFAGKMVFQALDLTGIENAELWDQGAIMRYRSRRDMLEISVNPIFSTRHDYKIGALDKTIATPVEADIILVDFRFLLALILFSVASLIDLALFRKRV